MIEIDRSEIPQSELDLVSRPRTNPFPWRGQFSPGLVELLLRHYAPKGGMVLDPFAGVGTTLTEAARLGLPCAGVEINPAAVAMAETVRFANLDAEQRENAIEMALGTLQHRRKTSGDWRVRNILVNVWIRESEGTARRRALEQHARIIRELPESGAPCRVEAADARAMPFAKGSAGLILSSPPYINVFNYHQNCRKAMEALGWDLLEVAKSEFGANRKHRGNRFLTIVQYALDMHQTFGEFARVLEPGARVILILGRESKVRGVRFENGELAMRIAHASGFHAFLRQERKFVNRFGATIYEDILHLRPSGAAQSNATGEAVRFLESALGQTSDPEVRRNLYDAIRLADQVSASPLYRPR